MKAKRILIQICLFCAAMLPAAVQAQFQFTTNNDGSLNISKYYCYDAVVVIPGTTHGLPVTSIGNYAFDDCSSLISVTIPTNIISIGVPAFWVCYSLTAITVDASNSVYCSVNGVLFNKSQTRLIEYPAGKAGSYAITNSVTSIGDVAFSHCLKMTSVTIPNSVTSIGGGAFDDCISLTSVTIPNSVTNIGGDAFLYCSKLTSITIPNSVTSIGDETFRFCSSLTSVTIPNSVTSIGKDAFEECPLTSVIIPNSVTNIGDYAFAGCSSLRSVTIGNSVTSIGDDAFEGCLLTSVIIPNSVTSIGDYAFALCSNSVMIPNSVTSIGDGVFMDGSLTAIMVDASNSVYCSVNGVLFNKSQTTLIEYPARKAGSYAITNSVTSIEDYAFADCYSLWSVTIPNSITSIGDYTFEGCTSLTNVTIPNSVTSIGVYAFDYCTSLTNVTIPNSVTSIGTNAFCYCTKLTAAYFQGNAPPDNGTAFSVTSATVYYLPGTTGWGATFGSRPTALWTSPYPVILSGGNGNTNLGVQNNQFGFKVSWATNLSVVVLAATDLANPVWTPVATNALVNGTFYFSDSQWTNYPGRFYQLRSP